MDLKLASRLTTQPILLVALVTLLGLPLQAQGPLTPADESKIKSLIQRLGDPRFRERESVSQELQNIGIAAKKFLIQAIQESPDPEVCLRCELLLPRIDFDFCWAYAAKFLGNSVVIKNQYRQIYRSEKDLWYALASQSPDLSEIYLTRCQELSNGPPIDPRTRLPVERNLDRSRYVLSEDRLASLLLIGAESRKTIPEKAFQLATKLFKRKWGGQYAKNTPPLLRNSYVIWAEELGSLPIEYVGDKKLAIARTKLRSSSVPATERQYALLTLARAKDIRDDDLIRGFLTDDAVCDTLFSKGVKTQVQMRDIALAATLYRADKDPSAFGFKNLKSDPEFIYRPSSLGFAGDDTRAEAFRTWTETAGMSR